jgi:hypothetical protein
MGAGNGKNMVRIMFIIVTGRIKKRIKTIRWIKLLT